jgi:hypothetical protein
MTTIDYRAMAEEWLEHIARHYEATRVRPRDVALIEHWLKMGFTLVAVRGKFNLLEVDTLSKRA